MSGGFFLRASGAAPSMIGSLMVRFVGQKAGVFTLAGLLEASLYLLAHTAMAPHGFIMIVPLPFWLGCALGLIVCLMADIAQRRNFN
ncbi:MAG: hypothetical protein P1U62_03965 [Alteraurantiacibacter sp. bin_em_oilr2.035]|nr:hypothetical protein [Aurantiacibacter atlanticus]MDF1834026.1 hypothetical protein [Alteraurantiacibacter sp. bin_em_oilr2.035]